MLQLTYGNNYDKCLTKYGLSVIRRQLEEEQRRLEEEARQREVEEERRREQERLRLLEVFTATIVLKELSV